MKFISATKNITFNLCCALVGSVSEKGMILKGPLRSVLLLFSQHGHLVFLGESLNGALVTVSLSVSASADTTHEIS